LIESQNQNAVVQRFFQGRSWREVAQALDLREDAAQKRVSRAVDKVRSYFVCRRIGITSSAIIAIIAANAVQTAPAGLATAVTATSLVGTGSFCLLATIIKTLLMKTTACAVLGVTLATAVAVPVLIAQSGPPADAPVTGADLRKGLVLHMTFDQPEADAGAITDSSSRGNHGRAGGMTWTAGGHIGGAYEFRADGDEIVVSNNASLNPKQLTLAAWIKTATADGVWRRIFDKSYRKGFALGPAGDWQKNQWRGKVSLEISGNAAQISKMTVADGTWHQVVVMYDGAAQRLHVDGQPQAKTFSWTGKVPANDFNLVIGCNRSNLNEPDLGTSFRGLIDEPMMWDRALSEKEVAFLFNSQGGTSIER
jgi:hypothetical protein